MNGRLGHGLVILGISLAIVGAVATSTDGGTVEAEAVAPSLSPALGSEEFVAAAPRFDIPIRSARISDEVDPARARPVTIRVAEIALDARIIPVGVDSNNQFDVPSAETVGWYQYSSSPGATGASVLAAHVDYGGTPGAFFNLQKVLPGDLLEVELDDGTVLPYLVTGNTVYDKTELPAGELFRKDGDPVLQLITCGGAFNPAERSYEANVVVTAVPVTA